MLVIKERPIIFSAEMVRAILEGRKTQTRRVIKPTINIRGTCNGIYYDKETRRWYWQLLDKPNVTDICLGVCPYGEIGDRLWVRETWARVTDYDGNFILNNKRKALYKADGESQITPNKWRSPIHMPRWASRITLEITNIRVERIQDITEDDAKAEGLKESPDIELKDGSPCYTLPFQILWHQIHGIDNPKSWEANPFVWVIAFKRIYADK